MCKLIDVTEDFKHRKILIAHESLFELLNLSDSSDLSLTNSNNCMLNIIGQLHLGVINSVCELIFSCSVVLSSAIVNWTDHFLETKVTN